MKNFVLAITGASGAAYAIRTLQVLVEAGHHVHLTLSPSAALVLETEANVKVDLNDFDVNLLLQTSGGQPSGGQTSKSEPVGKVIYHHYQDFMAGIASGSFLTNGMVVCPCSMGTLAAIAGGLSSNLIHRAADVHLKEKRKLILVPRETPLHSIALGNMKTLADAGAIILPAMPGFYYQPESIEDLVDFVVARICDQLGVSHGLSKRWSENEE